MPITGQVKLLRPGTALSASEQAVYQTSHEIDAIIEAGGLAPNLAASALLTSLIRLAMHLPPGNRKGVPIAMRNVAAEIEQDLAVRQ